MIAGLRRRLAKAIDRDLAHVHQWMVDLRVENVGEQTGRDVIALGATYANWNPPRAHIAPGVLAPEIEVTLEIWATTGDIAERQAQRRAERLHMNVLASRHWRWPDGESPMYRPRRSATPAEVRAAAEDDPRGVADR